jgi:hypothetical protein
MGATSMYALPWPELPEAANGPDGFTKLANQVDTQMTQWRSENLKAADIGLRIAAGGNATIWTNTYSVTKGWFELDIWVSMFGDPDIAGDACAAVTVNALVGGALVRSWYVHNDCKGRQPMLVAAGSGAREYTQATPGVVCQVDLYNAANGTAVMVGTYDVTARQFGSLT